MKSWTCKHSLSSSIPESTGTRVNSEGNPLHHHLSPKHPSELVWIQVLRGIKWIQFGEGGPSFYEREYQNSLLCHVYDILPHEHTASAPWLRPSQRGMLRSLAWFPSWHTSASGDTCHGTLQLEPGYNEHLGSQTPTLSRTPPSRTPPHWPLLFENF